MNQNLDARDIAALECLSQFDGGIGSWNMVELMAQKGYDISPATAGRILRQLEDLGLAAKISNDGRVNVRVNGELEPVEVGQLELYRFPNEVGLENLGDNLYKVTNASGAPIAGRPGFEGMGVTKHKFLEMSNVSVVNEMVQMIVAQRAYEFNSKAIQTSDAMLQTAVGIKR